jgi:hypothetical protein
MTAATKSATATAPSEMTTHSGASFAIAIRVAITDTSPKAVDAV